MTEGAKTSNRRTFLAGAGSVVVAGVFAGCNGGSSGGNGSANDTGSGSENGTSLQSETATEGETATEAGTADNGSEATTAGESTTGNETAAETESSTEGTAAGTETDAETTAAEATNETDAATATENGTAATDTETDDDDDEDDDDDYEGESGRDRNRLTFGEIRQEPPSELDSLNQEYVELINASGSSNDLSGYTITYGDGAKYTFDDGFELGVGDQVTVHTGSGDDSDTDVYVGRDSVALDYQGPDDVKVTDSNGNVVLEATA